MSNVDYEGIIYTVYYKWDESNKYATRDFYQEENAVRFVKAKIIDGYQVKMTKTTHAVLDSLK